MGTRSSLRAVAIVAFQSTLSLASWAVLVLSEAAASLFGHGDRRTVAVALAGVALAVAFGL